VTKLLEITSQFVKAIEN